MFLGNIKKGLIVISGFGLLGLIGLLSYISIWYLMLFMMLVFMLSSFIVMGIRYDKRHSSKCTWTKDADELSGEHKTQCGEVFNDATESGNPVTDWVTYCPYCSGKVKLK